MAGKKRCKKTTGHSSKKIKSESQKNSELPMDGTERCTQMMEHSPKKIESENKKNAELPMDLIVDVLLRLPIKPLVTFSVTSRLMYSLIYHPYFINLHFQRAQKNGGFLMKANNRGVRSRVQKLNPLCFFRKDEPAVQVFQPEEVGGGHHSIVSSCNGLICLIDFENWGQPFCIYNPTTREYVQVPLPYPPTQTTDAAVVYDWEISAHKVFRLYLSGNVSTDEARFDVLTLGQSTYTWRQKGIVPNYSSDTNKHIQAAGAVNWLFGNSVMLHSVLSIDIVTETWKVHPIPKTYVAYEPVLIELNGYLAICGITLDLQRMGIWVLKDAANSTWEMTYCADSPNWIARANVRTCVCPTSSFRQNKLLIWRGRSKLVFYDTTTRQSKRVDTSLASKGWTDLLVIDHIETLVPCKTNWRAVKWREINAILYNFFPVFGYPQPKMEIEEYEEGPEKTLNLKGCKEGPEGNKLKLQN